MTALTRSAEVLMVTQRSTPQLGETRIAFVVQSVEEELFDGETVLASEWEPEPRECACAHCLEDGHEEGSLTVEFANGQYRGEYRVTRCDGELWLCDDHVLALSRSQGVLPRAVVFGDAKSRSGHWDRLAVGPIGGVMKATRRHVERRDDAASTG